MKWPKAATNTQSDAASRSQLAVAQLMALQSILRSSIRAANRPASRSINEVNRSASRKLTWAESAWMIRAACSWPRVSK